MFRLLIVLTLLGVWATMSPVAFSQEPGIPPQSEPVAVMTYNVQTGATGYDNPKWDPRYFNLPKIAAIIGTQKPDIILMQEVDRSSERSGREDQPAKLAELMKMNWVFGAAVGNDNSTANEKQYGLAIFSRYPIISHEKYKLPSAPGKRREPRIALRAEIDINGTRTQVITTHFGLDPAERKAQGLALAQIVRKLRQPVILGGDFNAEPDASELKPITDMLTDPFTALKLERYWRLSWPSGRREKKAIDHLFISRDVAIQNVKVVKDMSHASDHNPVVGFFILPSGKESSHSPSN